MGTYPRVRFQGKEWILVGGAITTEQLYRDFEESFAHIFGEVILRHGEEIGAEADLEHIGTVEISIFGDEEDQDSPMRDVLIASAVGLCSAAALMWWLW